MKKKRHSIRNIMTRIVIAVCVLFAVLCLLISVATRHILINSASEYQKTTAQKLKNQLEMVYDKIDVFAMNICLNEDVLHLMTVIAAAQKHPASTVPQSRRLS